MEKYLKHIGELPEICKKKQAEIPELDAFFQALLDWYHVLTKSYEEIKYTYNLFKQDLIEIGEEKLIGYYHNFVCAIHEETLRFIANEESHNKGGRVSWGGRGPLRARGGDAGASTSASGSKQ